jgi:alpha-1,6-mannosyltransferase
MKSFSPRILLWSSGLAELAIAVTASRTIDREARFPIYLCLYLAMAVPWLVACYVVHRMPRPRSPERIRGRDVALLFLIAAGLRALFLWTDPVLSDDVYRYVWDGRVQRAGINPYLYPPSDPALAALRDEAIYPGINNKDIPTIYPPLMQAVFFIATAISESVFSMKASFVLVDFGLVWALMKLLEARGLHPLRSLVYAWSPLAAVEVAGSGHNDVLAVALLVAALWGFERGRNALSFVLLGGSGLAKLMGFALAPLFARFVKARMFAILPLLTVLVALPYASAGSLALRGLKEYGTRWRSNDSLFHVLFTLVGSLEVAKLVAATLVVLLVLAFVWKKTPPLPACYGTIGAILLLMPTVHPWYLLWLLPLLALYPNPAWLYLTVMVALSYHAPYLASPGAPWEETPWVKALEYVPFFLLLGLDFALDDARSSAGDPERGRAG